MSRSNKQHWKDIFKRLQIDSKNIETNLSRFGTVEIEPLAIKDEHRHLKDSLSKIQTLLSQPLEGEAILELKQTMEDVQSRLTVAKTLSRQIMEQLEQRELHLTADLKRFTEQLSKPESHQSINDFTVFLARTGGHQGGWDTMLHNAFLKLRNKFSKNDDQVDPAFYSLAAAKLLMTPSQVKEHDEWYTEYREQLKRNKLAIKTWKDQKEKEKQEKQVEIIQVIEKPKENAVDLEKQERFEKLRAYKV